MKITHHEDDCIRLNLSYLEAVQIFSLLGEICWGTPIPHFDKRVGCNIDEMGTIANNFHQILKENGIMDLYWDGNL